MGPLNDTAQIIHDTARAKGFYDREELRVEDDLLKDGVENLRIENPSLAAEKVGLMGEEVGELMKELRKGNPQGEAEECADIMIRVLDFCAWRGIDIEFAIVEKMSKNNERPYLHDEGDGRVF